ncbi:MAG: lycopene beta-cyclase [Bermanella sp.]|uniref:lycopene cyclase family protein n=1 Tax=Glaciecola sp. 33A TaxID=2057807 RepID=UPI000C33FC64|nr:lycopene cyclase family protein [Glaciecola sp. 33A]PKI03497.1 FAD-dependent oxidoreductase [Glaciecola sp. 33A]
MTQLSTKQSEVDLIIIGAGAAGLSLLLALDAANYAGKVVVLESRQGPQNDKMWSFWHVTEANRSSERGNSLPAYIEAILTHKWQSWSLSADGSEYLMHDTLFQYCCLRSESLCALALERTAAKENFHIRFDSHVGSITAAGFAAIVTTGSEQLSAKQVVDTRPPPLQSQHEGLIQCFYGEEIVCEVDVFEPSTVKLMHQLRHSEVGIEFIYILPFSTKHALVEFTCFSLAPVAASVLKARLTDAIHKIVKQHPYTIQRTECAALPMYLVNQNTQHRKQAIIYGGIAGGAMRASTGYSFIGSQKWATQSAHDLIKTSTISVNTPIPAIYQMMDKLMLSVLRNDMEVGVTIFIQLFKTVPAQRFVRFMSEKATLIDFVCIIWAMPKKPFLRALFRRVRVNIKNG